jgi:hypothetical protein
LSLCSFLQSPITSTLLDPIIFNTSTQRPSICVASSLTNRDQDSYPNKTTKIMVFIF